MDLTKPVSKLNHPHRRRSDVEIEQDRREIESLNTRMEAFEIKLDANTALTRRSVDMFGGLEAGIKVLGMLGTFAKWAAPIVALGVSLYAIVTGKPPMDK